MQVYEPALQLWGSSSQMELDLKLVFRVSAWSIWTSEHKYLSISQPLVGLCWQIPLRGRTAALCSLLGTCPWPVPGGRGKLGHHSPPFPPAIPVLLRQVNAFLLFATKWDIRRRGVISASTFLIAVRQHMCCEQAELLSLIPSGESGVRGRIFFFPAATSLAVTF